MAPDAVEPQLLAGLPGEGSTLGGLLGDGLAIEAAVERGAERVVLSTRIDDLTELRDHMDAAVALAVSLD